MMARIGNVLLWGLGLLFLFASVAAFGEALEDDAVWPGAVLTLIIGLLLWPPSFRRIRKFLPTNIMGRIGYVLLWLLGLSLLLASIVGAREALVDPTQWPLVVLVFTIGLLLWPPSFRRIHKFSRIKNPVTAGFAAVVFVVAVGSGSAWIETQRFQAINEAGTVKSLQAEWTPKKTRLLSLATALAEEQMYDQALAILVRYEPVEDGELSAFITNTRAEASEN
jgi:hypothetical protein